jgi:hypothetical protein
MVPRTGPTTARSSGARARRDAPPPRRRGTPADAAPGPHPTRRPPTPADTDRHDAEGARTIGDDRAAAHEAALAREARRRAAALRASQPARAAAQRFVGVCVEVLGGHRPISHLRAVTTTTDLARVTDQVVRRTTRAYLARPMPPGPRPHRVRLRSLHVSEPLDGVAEITAILEYGPWVWAMAARLERRKESWLCTLVQVV